MIFLYDFRWHKFRLLIFRKNLCDALPDQMIGQSLSQSIDRLELHAQLFIFVPAIDHRLLHTILPVLLLQFPIEKITGSGDEPGFQVGHIEKG